MKKKNIWLLLAALIGTVYLIYIIYHCVSTMFSSDSSESLAGGLASLMLAPHIGLVLIAVIFNWIGYLFKLNWAALTAAICYGVAMVVFMLYFMFVILEMIFCFIGYAQMKKAS